MIVYGFPNATSPSRPVYWTPGGCGVIKSCWRFLPALPIELVDGHGPKFVEDKLAEQDGRHERMGDTRYVVEPNIKEGKGGLEIFKHCIGLLNFYMAYLMSPTWYHWVFSRRKM